jgi:hypothetical protein
VKYIVNVEIDPETGIEVEAAPDKLQELLGMWQALKPIGMYFDLARRTVTIILDVPNEDAMFEVIHRTWVLTKSYPDIWPVGDATEAPAFMKRVGILS